jgi:hypothetical protein
MPSITWPPLIRVKVDRPIAGWPEERAREVEITGGADPVLPTPFRIGAAGAAALAATGLAAADLLGIAQRPPSGGRGRSAPGRRLAAQRALSASERRQGRERAQSGAT